MISRPEVKGIITDFSYMTQMLRYVYQFYPGHLIKASSRSIGTSDLFP